MHKDWPRMAGELSQALKEVRTGAPETMKAFSALARAALEPKALDGKTKELLALGIAVAIRCDGCIAFHAEAALKHGATRDEVMETVGMAIYMGAGPERHVCGAGGGSLRPVQREKGCGRVIVPHSGVWGHATACAARVPGWLLSLVRFGKASAANR